MKLDDNMNKQNKPPKTTDTPKIMKDKFGIYEVMNPYQMFSD
mgnify:CR=1 FL=1